MAPAVAYCLVQTGDNELHLTARNCMGACEALGARDTEQTPFGRFIAFFSVFA